MKLLLTLLLTTLCAATSYGQTMKALSYNTTNGVVAYSGTNKLTFTNEVRFGGGDLRIDSTGGIYWSGDLRYEPETQTFYEQIQFDSPATAATTRTNLGIPLAALTNNNVTNFRTAIGLGATNDVTFSRITADFLQSTTTNASIELDDDNFIIEAALLEIRTPITFDNSTNASVTRTNLGLPLPALTNTSNVTTMRALAGSTNTNTPASGTYQLTNIISLSISNGIIVDVEEP
jgi:hypothetical protein